MSVLQRDPTDRVEILDEDGHVREGAEVPEIGDDRLVEMYRHLRLARHFDERAVSLQRQGRMGTYPPLSGQEAAQVASSFAMDEQDWLVPSYREHAAMHAHGWPLEQILLYWMGAEDGNVPPAETNTFSVAVPIATQIPHAAGLAWAVKLKGDDGAVVCHFGDGGTSEGDFHEGLNFAGAFDVPAVFFCNNNQWAISVPRDRQTASETLAQKAQAYGFDGVQVDGMDPLAVYSVTKEALDRAKTGGEPDEIGTATRPTMIEAVQYRFGAHTTADDPTVYREESEVERWKQKDPIPRFETFLRERGLLDDERVETIGQAVQDEVADAIEAAEQHPQPEPAEMFASVYEDMPDRLEQQLAYLEELRDTHGDDTLTDE